MCTFFCNVIHLFHHVYLMGFIHMIQNQILNEIDFQNI